MLQDLSALPTETQIENPEAETISILGIDDSYLEEATVTLSLQSVTLPDALDATLTHLNYSYVIDNDVSQAELITLNFNQTPIKDALKAIGSSAGVEFRVDGSVIKVGKGGKEAIAVVPPLYGGREAASAIAGDVSDDLSISDIEGNIVVSGSRTDVLRFQDVAAEINGRPPGQWRVDVWILDISDTSNLSLGPSMDVAAAWDATSTTTATLSWSASLKADLSYLLSSAELITRSRLTLLEGRPSEISSTVRTPIPNRTVSPQGTVTTSGYTYVNAGLTVTLEGKPASNGMEVQIRPTLSNIQGFLDDVPIITERSTTASAIIKNGSILVLAGMEELSTTTDYQLIAKFGRNLKNSRLVVIASFTEIPY